MQTTGYIIDRRTGAKVKLLIRQGKKLDKFCYVIKMKMRKSGSDCRHFTTEEDSLNSNYDIMDRLIKGENIDC